jgi:hypothetical protein
MYTYKDIDKKFLIKILAKIDKFIDTSEREQSVCSLGRVKWDEQIDGHYHDNAKSKDKIVEMVIVDF